MCKLQKTTRSQPKPVRTNPDPEYVRVPAAARFAGVGRTTMYDWLSKRLVKSSRIGKIRLVNLASLRAYIDSMTD